MQVIVDIPDQLIQDLVPMGQDVSRLLLEVLTANAYRSHLLTEDHIRRILGYGTRIQIEAFLQRYGFSEYTIDDLSRETAELNRLSLGKKDAPQLVVVADTGPLHYLILLGHLQVLPTLFGRVLVPSSVLLEMQHPDSPSPVRAWAATPPPWVEIAHVQTSDSSLTDGFDTGAREAISLAIERHADVMLVDKLTGSTEEEAPPLIVAGTLALLVEAEIRNWLVMSTEIERLRQYGFYVLPSFVADFAALRER